MSSNHRGRYGIDLVLHCGANFERKSGIPSQNMLVAHANNTSPIIADITATTITKTNLFQFIHNSTLVRFNLNSKPLIRNLTESGFFKCSITGLGMIAIDCHCSFFCKSDVLQVFDLLHRLCQHIVLKQKVLHKKM